MRLNNGNFTIFRSNPSRSLTLILFFLSSSGLGQPAALDADNGGELVSFEAGFFSEYNPITALDMVEQVPGFQIDQGGNLRGFGGTAGNMLINHPEI